jgi:hypothetical protein
LHPIVVCNIDNMRFIRHRPLDYFEMYSGLLESKKYSIELVDER